MADSEPTSKPKKGRSPSYPGTDLEAAIDRARQVYQHEKHHSAPVETVLEHWGFAPKSGAGLVALAALKKFGLIEDEGRGDSRKAKLTARALDIIHDERPDSRARDAAIKEAALEPAIHRELFTAYEGKLPSDQNLRFELIRQRSFTDKGANDLIRELRSTFAFAKITESDTLSADGEDKLPEDNLSEDGMSAAASTVVGGASTGAETKDFQFSVTLFGGRLATIKAPVPITKRNLERLKRMIEDQLEPFIDGDDPAA